MEGISFDRETGRMFVSYNRGAQIVLGMPKGFYQGYDREIHEVFSYDSAIWAMPTGAEAFEPVRAMVTKVDRFGDLILDLESIDLEYGDSVDLSFSGGHEIKAVPYYPDFFGKRNDAILTDYFNGICVAGISCDLSKYIAYIIDTLNHDSSISDLLIPSERIWNIVDKYKKGISIE